MSWLHCITATNVEEKALQVINTIVTATATSSASAAAPNAVVFGLHPTFLIPTMSSPVTDYQKTQLMRVSQHRQDILLVQHNNLCQYMQPFCLTPQAEFMVNIANRIKSLADNEISITRTRRRMEAQAAFLAALVSPHFHNNPYIHQRVSNMGFLERLPAEVRNMIYKLVLISDRPIMMGSGRASLDAFEHHKLSCLNDDHRLQYHLRFGHLDPYYTCTDPWTSAITSLEVFPRKLALLCVNIQIYHEAMPIYYSQNEFVFADFAHVHNAICLTHASRISRMANMTVRFTSERARRYSRLIAPELKGLRQLNVTIDYNDSRVTLNSKKDLITAKGIREFKMAFEGCMITINVAGKDQIVEDGKQVEVDVNHASGVGTWLKAEFRKADKIKIEEAEARCKKSTAAYKQAETRLKESAARVKAVEAQIERLSTAEAGPRDGTAQQARRSDHPM